MGRPKALLPFGDGTVLGAVAAALRAGGAGDRVVVTAPGDRTLAGLAERLGLRRAINPDPSRGMLSSVRAGLAELGGGAALARRGTPLLVCPADLQAAAAVVRSRQA
jgi:CTP:molybdopterin cytidylyltransferase MocA